MRARRFVTVSSIAVLTAIVGFVFWLSRHVETRLFDLGHEHVEKIVSLHGQSLEAVVSELGEPTRAAEFPMSGCCDEFRIELWNAYSPKDPATANVRIKELIWTYAQYSIAVWFHQVDGQWIALDTCRWQKGIVF
jgi:hypothetical protein